jgi:outer membrane protein OmpA-like peptidoglycan-associated protein
MRKLTTLAALLVVLIPGAAICQTGNPGLSFKRLFLDYQTFNGGDFSAFRDYTDGLEFSYMHPFGERLFVDVPVKIGYFDKRDHPSTSVIGADVHVNYFLLPRERRAVPYLLAGVGAVIENHDSVHAQIPVGFGVDLRVAPNAYITWQSEVRFATADDRNNLHHGIGFRYFFGRVAEDTLAVPPPPPPLDIDGDGIPDESDLCPSIPGIPAFKGCPDTDSDGVQDSEDECPEYPGLVELNGCPDSDGDGISDKDDECPDVRGVKEYNGCPPPSDRDGDGIPDAKDRCPDLPGAINGCPDSDGDGVIDPEDRCPTIVGEVRYNGCPDSDGDGLNDLDDKCPTMAGPLDNDGCPPVEKEDKEILEFAMRAVQFEHGSARLKPESYRILNQVADIMERYPDYKLEISGHTDNTGTDAFNQRLSENRAGACYNYLVNREIDIKRMSYVGHGEARPIADNTTLAGRQLNRRVEFNLFPGK